MALFEVTAPDGTIYEFNGPDDATNEDIYAYVKTQLQGKEKVYEQVQVGSYMSMPERGYSATNASESAMGAGQFFIEMIVGAVVLAAIISLSKVHNLMWIPVVGFLVGYLISQEASYAFSNVFGGLTFSLLYSFIAGVWIQRQKKKGE